jgi:hypothetical protein
MHKLAIPRIAAVLLVITACDSEPTLPRPAALTVVSGGDQAELVGTPLPQPLVVSVKDSRSRPVADAWVQWRITEGGGTLSADSSRTDAQGNASVRLVLPEQAGIQRVSATLGGLAAVHFSVTAQTHCQAKVAKTLRVVAGDGQSPLTHDSVGVKLQVQALCDAATPVSGVAVAWEVAAGPATLYGSTLVTDASGMATTGVATGTSPGTATVRATVAGTIPAVFTATVRHRCDPRAPIAIGAVLQGTIAVVDCARTPLDGNSRYIVHELRVAETQLVRFSMITTGGDQSISLWSQDETRQLARSAVGPMHVQLEPGTYTVRLQTSPFAPGAAFTMRADPASVPQCAVKQALPVPVWIMRGAIVQGAIAPDDCGGWLGQPRYYDQYFIHLVAGEQVTATLRHGGGYTPALQFAGVQANQSGWSSISYHPATGGQVTASLRAPTTGIYAIMVDSGADNAYGTYSLETR